MSQARNSVAVVSPPRLPYPTGVNERFGVDPASWRALVDSVFPLAKTPDAIVLALSYCRARKLDPFKRVVHIVPMWNAAAGREVETVWPGIAEHRTTAFRTKQYAGADPAEFGPTLTETFSGRTKKGDPLEATLRFPEWCQITVYRIIDGQRIAFPGPRVYFAEWFSQRRGAPVPNERWTRAPFQMLEKCAEAAALRKAFPEELGDEPTADEMDGKVIDQDGNTIKAGAAPSAQPAGDDPFERAAAGHAAAPALDGTALDVAAETVDPETGEVIEPEKPAAAAPQKGDPQDDTAASRAQWEANAADEFWSRESYEVVPRKKGNSYQWREWEAELLGRARTVPGLMAGGKLRAHNGKWIKASAQWNPGHPAFVAEFDRLTVPAVEGEAGAP